MGKSQQSFNKKEREKKRQKKKKEKAERKEQRKQDALNGKTTEEFMYVDEFGNLTSTPPDPTKKTEIKLEDIQIGVPKQEDLVDEDPVRTGTVKFFNDEKGFGFIIDKISKENIFVHAAGLVDEIKQGNTVSFEIEHGAKGPQAVTVKIVK